MDKIKRAFKKITKIPKIYYFVFLLIISIGVIVFTPSLARYKNRLPIDISTVWDGIVADNYRSGNGTKENPYIISSGSELAYFSKMLETNDYENTYFKMSNDIVLNNGVFDYDTVNGIEYHLNESTFYIKKYTNEFYDNINCDGVKISTINLFEPLNNFKGYFDGNSYTIYGLYLTSDSANNLALFTDLSGTVENLYVENALVYGGNISAGIASNASETTIKDVLFDGNVVGNSGTSEKTVEVNLSDADLSFSETNPSGITIAIPEENIDKNIDVLTTTLTGTCTNVSLGDSISIGGIPIGNCENGTFEIELDNYVTSTLNVEYYLANEKTVTLSNLKYTVNYRDDITGGLIGMGENVALENVINKSSVYGSHLSAGLIGYAKGDIDIEKSYNTGSISGDDTSGGLIGKISGSSNGTNISYSYNSGEVNSPNLGSLIGKVENNTGTINIENTFSTLKETYVLDTVSSSTVSVSNSYAVSDMGVKNGSTSGSFEVVTEDNLKDKTFMTNSLTFSEFVDTDDLSINENNVWIYEEGELPILYTDDIKNAISKIYVKNYSWDNLSYDLNSLNFSDMIAFSINDVDNLKPSKEIYYYIHKSDVPLSNEGVMDIENWSKYEGEVEELTEEGKYIIYAKVIDYNDNISYMNSDLLILDLSNPVVTISGNNSLWNSSNNELKYTYIEKETSFTVNAVDDLSGIKSTEYYVTDKLLTNEELIGLDESNWIKYEDKIDILNRGLNIIYVRSTDDVGHTTYVNSDYITYSGYKESEIYAGKGTSTTSDNLSITDKSEVNMRFTYNDENEYALGFTHNIISNTLLPVNTRLILTDNLTNKVYEYMVNTSDDIYGYESSCPESLEDCNKKATYAFSLFKEIGSVNDIYYDESKNIGNINEDYTLNIDFSNTELSTNIENIEVYLEISADGDKVLSTLDSEKKHFSIYTNSESKLYTRSNYAGDAIYYNSNSKTDVQIEAGLYNLNTTIENIIDSSYEDKKLGLNVKITDINGSLVSKNAFKNIKFELGGKSYSPSDDGIVRINLEDSLDNYTGTLGITTYSSNTDLPSGNYYIVINSYASYDGTYGEEESSDELRIPLIVGEESVSRDYSFDVQIPDEVRIIDKSDENFVMNYTILQSGPLNNPNIRVSLYKKDLLTAYNQDYTIVDLQNYTSNSLKEVLNNVYYAVEYPIYYRGTSDTYNYFDLELIPSRFEKGGYKLVFELYDGSKKIGSIGKKFIIK